MVMAQTTGAWTLAELDRLPEDSNKYELVDGELLVTPAPSPAHEELAARLRELIVPYVAALKLGRVYTPRSVVRTDRSQVEPDLMVRPEMQSLPKKWEDMPTPLLVVEIASKSTRLRDHNQKRKFYREIGVPEYWIVDRETRSIRIISVNARDVVATSSFEWLPGGATEPLHIDVAAFFLAALGAP